MFPFKVYNYDELPQTVVSQLANGPLSTDAHVTAYDISPDHYLLLIPSDASPCVAVKGAVDASCKATVVHLKPFSSPTSTEKQHSNVNPGAMSNPDANSDGHKGSKDNTGENTVDFQPVKVPTHCEMKKYLRNSEVDFDSMNEPYNCHSKNDMMENTANCDPVNTKTTSIDSDGSKDNSVNYGRPLNVVNSNDVVNFGSMSTKRKNLFVKLDAVNIMEGNDSPIGREKANITNLASDVEFGVVNTSSGEFDVDFDSMNEPDSRHSKTDMMENTANCNPVNSKTTSIDYNSSKDNSVNYGRLLNVVNSNDVINFGSMSTKRRNLFVKLDAVNIMERNDSPIGREKTNITNLASDVEFGVVNTSSGEFDVDFDSMNEPDNRHSKTDRMENTANCDPVNTKTTSIDCCNSSKDNSVNYGRPLNVVNSNDVVNFGSMITKRKNLFVNLDAVNIMERNDSPIGREKTNITNLAIDVEFGVVNTSSGEFDVDFDSNEYDTNPGVNCHSTNVAENIVNYDVVNTSLNTERTISDDSSTKSVVNHDTTENSVNYGQSVNIFKGNPVDNNCGSMGIKLKDNFVKFTRVIIADKDPIPSNNVNISNLTTDIDFDTMNAANGEYNVSFDSVYERCTIPDIKRLSENDMLKDTDNRDPVNKKTSDSITKSVFNYIDSWENNYGHSVNIIKRNPVANCGLIAIKRRNPFVKFYPADIAIKNPICSEKISISNSTTDVNFDTGNNSTNGESEVNCHLMTAENQVNNCDLINIIKGVNNIHFGVMNTAEANHDVKENPINAEEIPHFDNVTTDELVTCDSKNTASWDLLYNADLISRFTEDKLLDTKNSSNSDSMCVIGDDRSVDCDAKNTENPIDICDQINTEEKISCDTDSNICMNSTKRNPMCITEDIHSVHFDSKNFAGRNPIDSNIINIEQENSCDPKNNTDMHTTVNINPMSISEDTHNVNCDPKNSTKRHPPCVIRINEDELCQNSENRSVINNDTTLIAGDNSNCDFKNTENLDPIDCIDQINSAHEDSSDPINKSEVNPTVDCNSMPVAEDTHNVNSVYQNTANGNPIYDIDILSSAKEKLCDTNILANKKAINNDSTQTAEDDQCADCNSKHTADYNPTHDSNLRIAGQENCYDFKGITDKNPTINNSIRIARDTHCVNFNPANMVDRNPIDNTVALNGNPRYFVEGHPNVHFDHNYSSEYKHIEDKNLGDFSDENPIAKSYPMHIAEHNYTVNWDSNNTTYKNLTHNNDLMNTIAKMPCVNKIAESSIDMNPVVNSDPLKIGGNIDVNYNCENSCTVNRDLISMGKNNSCDPMNPDGSNPTININPKNTPKKFHNSKSQNVVNKNSFINIKPINRAEDNPNKCDPYNAADKNSRIDTKPMNAAEGNPNNCDSHNTADKYSLIYSKPMNTVEENPNNCDPHNAVDKNSRINSKQINAAEGNPNNCDLHNVADKYSLIYKKQMNTAEDNPNNCDPYNAADKYSFINIKPMNTTKDNPNNCESHTAAHKYSSINSKPMNSAEDNPNISCRPQNVADTSSFMNGRLMNTMEKNNNTSSHSQYAANKYSFINCKQINTTEKNYNCDPQDDTDKNSFMNSKQINTADDIPKSNCSSQNAADKNTFINRKPTNTDEKSKLNTTEDPNINSRNVAEKNSFINNKPMNTAEDKPNINCDFQNATATDKSYFNNSKPMYTIEDNSNNCDLQNTTDRNIVINSNFMITEEDNANINLNPQNGTDKILRNTKRTGEESAVLHKNTNRNITANKYSTEEHFNVNCTTLNNTNIDLEVQLNSSNSVALSKNNNCPPMNNLQNNPDKCNPNNSTDPSESDSEICFLEENTSRFKDVDNKISGENLLDLHSSELQCHSLRHSIPTCLIETECGRNPLDQCVNGLPIASANSLLKEKYESLFGMKPSLSANCASHSECHKKQSVKFEPNLEKLKLLKTKIDNLKSGNYPRTNLMSQRSVATVDLLTSVKSKLNFNAKYENLSVLKERYILLASKGKDTVRNTRFEMDKNKMESFKTKIAHLRSIVCSNRNSMYENGISATNLIQNKSVLQSQQSNETKMKELFSLKENFKSQLAAKNKLNNKGAIANNIQGSKFVDLSPQLVQNLKAQRKRQIYATFLSAFHPHNNKAESLNKEAHPSCSYVEQRKMVIRKTIAEQLNNSLLKRNMPDGASSLIQKNKEQIGIPGMASTSKLLQLPSMHSAIFNEQCKENSSGEESCSQYNSAAKIVTLNKPVSINSPKPELDTILHNQKSEIQNAVSKPEKNHTFENNSKLLSVRRFSKASIRPEMNLSQILICNRAPTNIPSGQSMHISLNLKSNGNFSKKESDSHLNSVCILNKQVPANCNLKEKSKAASILYKQKPEICSVRKCSKSEKYQFKNSSEMHFSLLNSKASEMNLNRILNCNIASILKSSEQAAHTPLYTLPLNTPVSASCNLNKMPKIVSSLCKQKPAICSAEDSYIKIFKLNRPVPPNNLNEKSDCVQLNQKLGISNFVSNPKKCEAYKNGSILLYSKAPAELNIEKNQNLSSNCALTFKFSERSPSIRLNALTPQLSQKSSENASDSYGNVILNQSSALRNQSLTERSKFIRVQHNQDFRLGSVTFETDTQNKCSSRPWELYSKSSTHSYSELNEESNCNSASINKSPYSEIVELNSKVNCNNSSDRRSHSEIELNKKLNCNNSSYKTSSHSEIELNEKFNCKCSNPLEQRLFLSSNAFNPQCTKCLDTNSKSQLNSDRILNYGISRLPRKPILKNKFRLVTNKQEQSNGITKQNSTVKKIKFPEPLKMQLIDKGATLRSSVFQNVDNLSADCEEDLTMQHLSKDSVVASPGATKPFYEEINKSELCNLRSSFESFVSELENNKIIHEDKSPKPLKKSAVGLHNSTSISPNYSYKKNKYENSKMKYLGVQLQRLPPEVIKCYLSGNNAGARSSNGNELAMVFQKQPEYICDMTLNNECRKQQLKRKIITNEITNQREKIQRIEKCSEDGFVRKDCSFISTDVNNSLVEVGRDSSANKIISSTLGVSKEDFLSNPNLPLMSDSEYIFDLNSYKEDRNKQCKRKRTIQGAVNLIENKKKIDYGFECRKNVWDDVDSDSSSTSTDSTLSADEGASMEPFLSNFEEIENSGNCVIAKEVSSTISQKLPVFITESTSYESTFDSWCTRKKLEHLRNRVASYKRTLKVVSENRKSVWRVATTHKELRVKLFKLPYLPNKIEVPLVQLPDLIYEKHRKGKPIMLSNVMPLLGIDSDINAPGVVGIPEISPQSEAPHNDSTVSVNKLPCLPNKLKVDLFKLPDDIYEKHSKGKPIMLSNILPTISKVESVSVNEPFQISDIVVKIERMESNSL